MPVADSGSMDRSEGGLGLLERSGTVPDRDAAVECFTELQSRLDAVVDENADLLGALEGQQNLTTEHQDAFVQAARHCKRSARVPCSCVSLWWTVDVLPSASITLVAFLPSHQSHTHTPAMSTHGHTCIPTPTRSVALTPPHLACRFGDGAGTGTEP
jgi:hypothetical protein